MILPAGHRLSLLPRNLSSKNRPFIAASGKWCVNSTARCPAAC